MINRKQFPQFLAPYCIACETSVGAVIFHMKDGERQYLLLKYRNGHWEFPRGKMEDQESEIDTMRREICEETGITDIEIIKNFRHSMRFSYVARGQERENRVKEKNCIFIYKKAIFYLAHAREDSIVVSDEHQSFVWMTYDKAMKQLTYDNARKILTAAHTLLSH